MESVEFVTNMLMICLIKLIIAHKKWYVIGLNDNFLEKEIGEVQIRFATFLQTVSPFACLSRF